MARLVKAGTNTKGGFNYQVVLDSEEDIKCLIRLYKALEKGGLIPKNSNLKEEWGSRTQQRILCFINNECGGDKIK